MKHCPIMAAIAAAVALSGCTDPKEASISNFQKSLEAYHAKQQTPAFCASLSASRFDKDKRTVSFRFSDSERGRREAAASPGLAAMEAMVESGAAERTSPMTYAITDSGITLNQTAGNAALVSTLGLDAEFTACAGRFGKLEVTGFTEPAPDDGMTVSLVDFTATSPDVPSWMTAEAVKSNVRGLDQAMSEGYSLKAVAVLKNDGWEVTRVTR
jgi:hypothetical protein